tara:strand:+ start:65 stop:502 length:438 start_codon:yes stop_codon:yes gene_type:complete
MSSKFATPFFQKSPLQGAYTSGADAIVTTSVAPYFNKLQQDIGTAVSKSLMKPVDKCAQGAEYWFDSSGAKFLCDKDSKEPTVREIKYNQSVTDQATEAEDADIMADINSTEEFLQNEEIEDAAELKQQKKEAAKIISNFQGFEF